MYVELKNINKTYGSYQASRNVNFGIEKGKLIGLLGPSGSGKTTILRMIAGLENPDSGEIIIDGKVVNDVPASERGIGFVFQNYALFPTMTVKDNILKLTDVNPNDPNEKTYGTYDKIRFYGYDNTDTSNQTSMKIIYKVDGVVMDCTYPIKTKPGNEVKVVGGNLYKLYVTIGNASEDIEFVIEDWISNTVNVGDIFGGK